MPPTNGLGMRIPSKANVLARLPRIWVRGSSGFTIVEVLIVIGILAVVAGIISIVVGPSVAKSRSTPGCASNLRSIAAAYNLYYNEHNAYPYNLALTLPPLSNDYHLVVKCPLKGRPYLDEVGTVLSRRSLPVLHTHFPNGLAIPEFNFETDVLVRCLDHGYDGFSRGSSEYWVISPELTVGKVLGVRLDGSVTKVSPLSCWWYRTQPDDIMDALSSQWQHCDGQRAH